LRGSAAIPPAAFRAERGAAAHLEPAGHDALASKTAVDAAAHRAPDPVKPGVKLLARHVGFFVGPLHLRDRQARTRRHFEHLLGMGEGIGNGLVGLDLFDGFERSSSVSVTTKPPPTE
jgi:hypothetical protein